MKMSDQDLIDALKYLKSIMNSMKNRRQNMYNIKNLDLTKFKHAFFTLRKNKFLVNMNNFFTYFDIETIKILLRDNYIKKENLNEFNLRRLENSY